MSQSTYDQGDVTREVIVDYFNRALPGIHCLHEYTDLKKICSSVVHANSIVWIQGITGSGQTFIFRKLRKRFQKQIVEIDKSIVIENQTATLQFSADAIGKSIFVGSFSRRDELLAHLSELAVVKSKAMHLSVVHIIPDFRFVIELHKFRLSEIRKANLHLLPHFEEYKKWAVKLTNLTSMPYLKYMKSITNLTSKHIQIASHQSGFKDVREYFYVPPIEGTPDMVSISN